MDAKTRLLPDYPREAEYAELYGLMRECEAFLVKWTAYVPWRSGASPDAVVAVHDLYATIVARREYLLDELVQMQLPF